MTNEVEELKEEIYRLRGFMSQDNHIICQILGKVLDFPWYKDDQKNFPGATEKDGICEGWFVAEDLANMAADKIKELKQKCEELENKLKLMELLLKFDV